MKALIKGYIKDFVYGALIIVLGILFCVFKNSIMDTLEIIYIVLSILYGTLVLVMYFGFDHNENDISSVVQAVLYIIFGFLTLMINNFFLYAIALNLAVLGVRYIVLAVKSKGNMLGYKLVLGYSIFAVLLSLLIFITCILSLQMDYLMIIIGCCLMVIGVLNIALTCILIRLNYLIQNQIK